MNTSRPLRALAAPLLACLATSLPLVATPLAAHDYRAGDLELLHPTASPTPPGVSSAAAYLVIVNGGDEDDRLLGGRTASAAEVELHRTTVEDDVARMRRLDDGLPIPAGETVRLDPGGTHLMLVGLVEALPDGERRTATLTFERAGDIEIELAIERPGSADSGMDHGEMDHGEMDHDVTTR